MKKLLAITILGIACSSPNQKPTDKNPPPTKTQPTSLPENWRRCLTGISGLSGALDPHRRLEFVVTSCIDACRPKNLSNLKDISQWEKGDVPYEEVVAQCDLFCSEEAKAAKAPDGSINWREVSRVCGGSYYRLPVGQESLLTQDWAALFRVAEYVGRSYQAAKQEKSEALVAASDRLFQDFWIPMPLPTFIENQYRLPVSETTAEGLDTAVTITEHLYLRASKGRYFVGAVPVVKLSQDGLQWLEVPGLSWPSDADLSTLPAQLEGYETTWEKTVGSTPKKQEPPPTSTSAPTSTSGPTSTPNTPSADEVLYVADANSPVSWLSKALAALPGRALRIAVARQNNANKHIVKATAPGTGSTGAGVSISAEGCSLSAGSTVGFIPKSGANCDMAQLRASLSAAKTTNPTLASLELTISSELTLAELVKLFDLAGNLGISTVWLKSTAAGTSQPTSTSQPAPKQP